MQNSRHAELLESTNRIGVDFLFADLEMAYTFFHVAETSTSAEARARNYSKALEGYRTVLHFLPRVMPSAIQRIELQERLGKLKAGLAEAGYSCDS